MVMSEDKALVPSDGRTAARVRGEDGLLPAQREYLAVYSDTGSPAEALRRLRLTQARVTRWLREDPAFLRVHEDLFKGSYNATKARFGALQERLPDLALDLMQAHKVVVVKHICTECGNKQDVAVDTTNDTVRARMWSDLMKAAGHLKDVRRVEGDVSITHLTAGQRIALEKLRRGLDISVQQRKELEAMGALEGLKRYDGSGVVEDEVTDAANGL
jgi:hypothetical protein